ncbi:MAG: M23 family metallopeptidase [Timaviella obliquedivisa GSE-PSE-MK23-08B]|nr:M23 family metallopeptidase [Timaviella obliquedivisa GSE-PSE-MK23-08B]
MENTQPIQPIAPTTGAASSTAQPAPTVTNAAPPSPTIEEILKVCPDANRGDVEKNLPYILKAMAANGLTSKNQLVGIVATFYVETLPKFVPRSEIEGGSAPYAPYYGRGYFQLTWDYNYKSMGDLLGIDLVNNPDKANEPEIAAQVAILYWMGKHNPDQRCVEPADAGDWHEVRRRINGSATGYNNDYGEVFKPCVDRGIEVFKSGIDPNAIASLSLPGNYGLNCVDTGNAGSRAIAGGSVNPPTQGDALAYALGLHSLDREKVIQLHTWLNPAEYPELLTFAPTKKFQGKNFGTGLDGEMTIETVKLYCGGTLEMELFAHQPDPNAPKPQIFRHDASQPPDQNTAAAVRSFAGGASPSNLQWAMNPNDCNVAGEKCEFGTARGRMHEGIDLGGFGSDDVFAAGDGTVEFADWDGSGYGRMIDIKHPTGFMTRYAHLLSIKVKVGQQVKGGEAIAVRGGSGFGSDNAYAIHLHFEVHDPNQGAVNPRDVLPQPQPPMV